jgi:hypothetical protein
MRRKFLFIFLRNIVPGKDLVLSELLGLIERLVSLLDDFIDVILVFRINGYAYA